MPTDYSNRLKVPLEGDSTTSFTTKSGLPVATGYTRVVLGGRGPYVEFEPSMIVAASFRMPQKEAWRRSSDISYYLEYRSVDQENVKLYRQKKLVDYADYKVGMVYISPFELMVDGELVIEPLRKRKQAVQEP